MDPQLRKVRTWGYIAPATPQCESAQPDSESEQEYNVRPSRKPIEPAEALARGLTTPATKLRVKSGQAESSSGPSSGGNSVTRRGEAAEPEPDSAASSPQTTAGQTGDSPPQNLSNRVEGWLDEVPDEIVKAQLASTSPQLLDDSAGVGFNREKMSDDGTLEADTETSRGDTESLRDDTEILREDTETMGTDTPTLEADTSTFETDISTLKADIEPLRADNERLRGHNQAAAPPEFPIPPPPWPRTLYERHSSQQGPSRRAPCMTTSSRRLYRMADRTLRHLTDEEATAAGDLALLWLAR